MSLANGRTISARGLGHPEEMSSQRRQHLIDRSCDRRQTCGYDRTYSVENSLYVLKTAGETPGMKSWGTPDITGSGLDDWLLITTDYKGLVMDSLIFLVHQNLN